MASVKIRKNDEIEVIQGRDRGARGKVLQVLPSEGKAVVERVNMIHRHTRPNPTRQVKGGILEREAPILLSKVMLVCPDCGKPTRVGRERSEAGVVSRGCRRCGAKFN